MANSGLIKGQKVSSPEGPGEVLETRGDKIVVKLESGTTVEYPSDEITDESSAG